MIFAVYLLPKISVCQSYSLM